MKTGVRFFFRCLCWVLPWGGFQQLAAQTADTVQMNNWYDSMAALMYTEPQKAMAFVQKGLNESRRGQNLLWEGYFLQSAGIIHDLDNQLDSSLFYFEKTIEVAKKMADLVMEANALGNIGVAYQERGYLQPALSYQLAAARLREQQPNKIYLSKSYNNIGLLYRAKKDYKKALEYLNKSLVIKQAVNDSAGMATTFLNLGSCYQHLGKYDSAKVYAQKTFDIATQLNNINDKAAATGNLGLALLAKGDNENALQQLKQALVLMNEHLISDDLFSVYLGLSTYYQKNGNIAQSKTFVLEGLKRAKLLNRREQVAIFQKALAKLYEGEQNFSAAYSMLNKATLLSDSLLNEANSRQINEMNIVYETELKENSIERLTTETVENRLRLIQNSKQRNLLLLALGFVLIIAMVIGYALKHNQRKNKLLNTQKNTIEQQLQEKEILMGEIHHRVKNNLQIISGLLSLQSRHIAEPNALQAIREGRNRVKSIALIHQQLYQRDNLTAINLHHYLKDLLHSIQQSFKEGGYEIEHELLGENVELDVEVAVPIGLIMNELVTNSYKYAFKGSSAGKIVIEITIQEPEMEILVHDNGIGLPEGFDWKNTKTFGLKMIGTLVNKLKASIDIYTKNGTWVSIKIPNYTNIT